MEVVGLWSLLYMKIISGPAEDAALAINGPVNMEMNLILNPALKVGLTTLHLEMLSLLQVGLQKPCIL